MYSFFVLGQIPGTDITISFSMWLEAGLLVLAITTLVLLVHSRRQRDYLLPPTINPDDRQLALN